MSYFNLSANIYKDYIHTVSVLLFHKSCFKVLNILTSIIMTVAGKWLGGGCMKLKVEIVKGDGQK